MVDAEPIRPDLSVVIPVHNEVQSLPVLWDELVPVLDALHRSAEIVFVDDGSTDGSGRVIRELVKTRAGAHSVHLRRRQGLSAAFLAGYRAASGEIIVTLDSDLQNDPRDIPALLAALGTADSAVGWRSRRHDTLTKRISSRVANVIRRRVLGDDFHDSACSLRAMSRRCLEALPPYDGMHRFVPVLLAMAGLHVVEVPVNHRPRRFGVSKFGIRNRAWRAFVDLLAVRWMRARRIRPPTGTRVVTRSPAAWASVGRSSRRNTRRSAS